MSNSSMTLKGFSYQLRTSACQHALVDIETEFAIVPTDMQITTLTSIEAQHHLVDLIESVHAENSQVRITGKGVQVRLVSERMMKALDKLISEDTALTDSLAFMLNTEAQSLIEKGEEEIAKGEKIPFNDLLK